MAKIGKELFVVGSTLDGDGVYDKKGKVIDWHDYLINILHRIIPQDLEHYYEDMLTTINSSIRAYYETEFAASAKEDASKKVMEANNKVEEIKKLYARIASIATTIKENPRSLTQLMPELGNLNNGITNISKYSDAELDSYLSSVQSEFDSKDKDLTEKTKRFVSLRDEISQMLNSRNIKEDKDLRIPNIAYREDHKQELESLVGGLRINAERKAYFISLVEAYINSKISSINHLNNLANEIIANPDMLTNGSIRDNQSLKLVELSHSIEQMFYNGNGSISSLCSGSLDYDETIINGEKVGLQIQAIPQPIKERIEATISGMQLGNRVLCGETVDLEYLKMLNEQQGDPQIQQIITIIENLHQSDDLKR